ncbi:uncharacterized protein LOC121414960 [Lytechinus variegatus]|uniref:uncharacterized protein LOC121414960 n=1 Tax=Lytechinus variegatus TaxID=7654 RepID=UPI001BB18C74|nr:uncharacterized protein LOC121414960 [Lytechinus variegatus]
MGCHVLACVVFTFVFFTYSVCSSASISDGRTRHFEKNIASTKYYRGSNMSLWSNSKTRLRLADLAQTEGDDEYLNHIIKALSLSRRRRDSSEESDAESEVESESESESSTSESESEVESEMQSEFGLLASNLTSSANSRFKSIGTFWRANWGIIPKTFIVTCLIMLHELVLSR